MALAARAPGVSVAIPAAFPGPLARLSGFAWVLLSLTGVLSPQYYDNVFTYTQPAVFGELAFMFWLLIKGARPPALAASASSAPA